MQCPFCDDEMRFGLATVKGTFFSFPVFGTSYKNLYFTPDDKPGAGRTWDVLILESGDSCHAWNCNGCEITLLDRRGRIGPKKERHFANWWEKYH